MKKIIFICLLLLSFTLNVQAKEKRDVEVHKEYYNDGTLMAKVETEKGVDVWHRKEFAKFYWPNGKLMAKTGVIGYTFTNPTKLYYTNGRLWIDWIHKKVKNNKDKDDDLFTGTQKVYYKNGKLSDEIEIKNGKPTKRKSFYPNGKVKTDGVLSKDGKGSYKTYYDDGNLAEETKFKDDKFISGFRYDRNKQKIQLTNEELDYLTELYSLANVRNKDTGSMPHWLLIMLNSTDEKAQKEKDLIMKGSDMDKTGGDNSYVLTFMTKNTLRSILNIKEEDKPKANKN